MVSLKTKAKRAAFGVPTLWMSKTKEHQAGPVSPIPFPRRTEINIFPWDEQQKRAGVEEYIHVSFSSSFRQQGPILGNFSVPNCTCV